MSQFKEFFSAICTERLFESNRFIEYTTNVSEYLQGQTIHIPQYNANLTIAVNGSNFTGPTAFDVTRSFEQSLSFRVDEYSLSQPFMVSNYDELLTAYSKLQLETNMAVKQITQQIGNTILNKIAAAVPTSKFVYTTGSEGANNSPLKNQGRKKVSYSDILSIAQKFNEDNLPAEGRYIVMEPQLYRELLSDPAVISFLNFGEATLPTGVVREVGGINIIVKPSVAIASSSGTVNAIGDTTLATDNFAALAFHTECLVRGDSGPIVFTEAGNAFKRGNICNITWFLSVVNPRQGLDDAGVYLLVQD